MAANDQPMDAAKSMIADLKLYHDIGLDSEGRSHFYSAEKNEIVVCEGDRRGRGIRDDDVVQRITPPEWSTGVWDYVEFVRDEVDGVEWAEVDAPTEASA